MFAVNIGPDANRGVGAAFTNRHGGVSAPDLGPLNLGVTQVDDIAAVEVNFERVRRALGVRRLITSSQVHGNTVLAVDEEFLAGWGHRSHLGTPGGTAPLIEADAMVTTLTDTALVIRVADCVPILLADHDAGVIGAVHAGRAGFLGGVVSNTVARMRDLGAGDVTAWIGPHICGACYEVPAEMAAEVGLTHPEAVAMTSWGTPSLDLGRGVEAELEGLGVLPVRLDRCTRTGPDLHSHRRDNVRAGRMAAIIWRVSGKP